MKRLTAGRERLGDSGFPYLLVLLMAVALSACDGGFFVDPPSGGQTSLELRIASGETRADQASVGQGIGVSEVASAAASSDAEVPARVGAAQAFDRVNAVSVQVVASGGAMLLNEVVEVQPTGGQIALTFEFDLEGTRTDAAVEVELRIGQEALFTGQGTTTLERGRTARSEVALAAVPAGIRIPEPPAPLEALGDTLELSGAVVFASGDTIPGLQVEWESDDPGVVSVTSDGIAVAISEGETELTAFFQEFRENLPVRVAPVVTQVEVTPAEAEVDPGESLELSAETRDRRGNVLPGREVTWSSSDEQIATVDSEGRVQTFRPGSVEITAVSEAGEGSALITVRLLDPVVRTLEAEAIEVDGATLLGDVNPRGTSTSAVFRWGTNPTLLEGAQLTSPVDVGDGLEAVRVEAELDGLEPVTTYYFRMEASTGAGVFSGPILSFTTLNPIPAPTELEGEFVDGVVALAWSFDDSGFSEVVFEVERRVEDPDEEFGDWALIGTGDTTSFTDLEPAAGATAEYRVRACVEEICSPWSDSALVQVPEAGPARVVGLVRLDGAPVVSIQVRLSGDALEAARTTQTVPGGTYAFNDVEAGQYVVEVIPASVELPDESFPSRQVEITVFGFGEVRTVNFDGVAPPLPPEGITIYWFGEMQVSWTPAQVGPEADQFRVERAVVGEGGPGPFSAVGQSTSETSFSDDAPGGDFWAYRVRACRGQVCSEPSAPDSTWSPVTAVYGVVSQEDGQPASGTAQVVLRSSQTEASQFATPGGDFGSTPLPPGHFKLTDRFTTSVLPGPGGSELFDLEAFDDATGDSAFDSVTVGHGQRVRRDLRLLPFSFPVLGSVREGAAAGEDPSLRRSPAARGDIRSDTVNSATEPEG